MSAASPHPISLDRYLGSARVVRTADRSLLVVLEEGTQVFATLALGFPYRPVPGDELLVIGDADAFYAIGLLSGRGRTSLSHARGVRLHAAGRLRLIGDRGIDLTTKRLRFEAERLERLAWTAIETLRERTTQVRDELKQRAGEADERSDGRWTLYARGVVLKALTGARLKSTAVRVG